MQSFRQLQVWKEAHELALEAYRVTQNFPVTQRFIPSHQIQKSAVSISSNIAEGCGRTGAPEFARFLRMAAASASELEYQLLLARDLDFLPESEFKKQSERVVQVRKMLAGLIRAVRRTDD